MLRVVVESAKGLPKKKVGSPDPVTSIKFKGKSLWEVMEVFFFFLCRKRLFKTVLNLFHSFGFVCVVTLGVKYLY